VLYSALERAQINMMDITVKNVVIISAEVGKRNFFFESTIVIPQLEGSTCAVAIPQLFKEMLLHKVKSATWPQFSAYLWPWNLID
jgi:hypothetical protein